MAGFITGNYLLGGYSEFRNDTPEVVKHIRAMSMGRKVVTLQLDGDELEAALWGFENYRKAGQITEEIPIQQQLQYRKVVCPNCFATEPKVYDIPSTDLLSDDYTHGCHECGQQWRVEE